METEFFRHGAMAIIRLNRPHVLNALGPAQFQAIHAQLAVWMADDAVGAIVLEGAAGRAFCAGGDIRAVWDGRARGDHDGNRRLFRDEYSLDRMIHRLPKPIVSLLDGIVMGGGAGLSVNGRFQVVTERTVFAMPEAAIGFFPDVGATHFLSRCPGRIGLYLGLTGARLGAADMIWAGLASHYVPSQDLPDLKDRLISAAAAPDPVAAIQQVLDRAHVVPAPAQLAEQAASIDRCFGCGCMGDVIAAVDAETAPWAEYARRQLAMASPTSLAVIHRQLSEGRGLSFEDAMVREYRMACAFLAGTEFYEGIRAAVVDKDWRPRWHPGTLAEVSHAMVENYFAPIEDELTFTSEGPGNGRP